MTTSTLTTQRLSDGSHLLFLPLPPSTNQRQTPVFMKGHMAMLLTSQARNYIKNVGMILKLWSHSVKLAPIDRYRFIDLWWILATTAQDNHNYFKVLFDAMEEGGIVVNDKYLMPRTMGIFHDTKEPGVWIKL